MNCFVRSQGGVTGNKCEYFARSAYGMICLKAVKRIPDTQKVCYSNNNYDPYMDDSILSPKWCPKNENTSL